MFEMFELLMEEYPVAVYVFTFLFGLCVGSFLNVCIYRIPENQSFVVVPSHCMTCNKKLHWYELIPLFSWLFLRGKCLGCKSKISAQYPLIESANAVLWLIVLWAKGFSPDMFLYDALVSALLVIAIIDYRTKEIPNGIVAFCLAVSVLHAVVDSFAYSDTWLDHILGGVVLGLIFFLVLFISEGRALGGGDVKLMFAVGFFLGLKCGVLSIFIACLLGSVIHLALMKIKHLGRELAFGPYLAAGYAISALWGQQILNWYFEKFISISF